MSLYYSDSYVTVYHGDCLTEHREWLAADVLVTDPPYGMAYEDRLGKHAPIAGDDSTDTRENALRNMGQQACPRLIWDKGSDLGMGASNPWGLSHEEVYVLGEWPAIIPGGRVREGGVPSRAPSVLRVQKPNNASTERVKEHPTPKPVMLMERLITRCPSGVIADPFAGSGATLIAARNLRRQAVGVELEERYCELIASRLSQDIFDLGALA